MIGLRPSMSDDKTLISSELQSSPVALAYKHWLLDVLKFSDCESDRKAEMDS